LRDHASILTLAWPDAGKWNRETRKSFGSQDHASVLTTACPNTGKWSRETRERRTRLRLAGAWTCSNHWPGPRPVRLNLFRFNTGTTYTCLDPSCRIPGWFNTRRNPYAPAMMSWRGHSLLYNPSHARSPRAVRENGMRRDWVSRPPNETRVRPGTAATSTQKVVDAPVHRTEWEASSPSR
jgi:hypothetical protein